MIKGVVFDFGGVMTTSTMPKRVEALAAEKGIAWDAIVRGFAAHRLKFDSGTLSATGFYEQVWNDAGISVDAATTAAFVKADDESWLYRNERSLEWIKSLKSRGFKIGILTNMSVEFRDRWFIPYAADYAAMADAIVVSGEYRLFKPEPAIYAVMEKKLGLSGRELLFLDDNLPNVEGARRCGWRAELFVSG